MYVFYLVRAGDCKLPISSQSFWNDHQKITRMRLYAPIKYMLYAFILNAHVNMHMYALKK